MNKQLLTSLILVTTLSISGCFLEGDDGAEGPTGPQGSQSAAGNDGQQGSSGEDGKNAPRDLSIEVVGRFAKGTYGKSAAEIVQFHRPSQSVFAINGADN